MKIYIAIDKNNDVIGISTVSSDMAIKKVIPEGEIFTSKNGIKILYDGSEAYVLLDHDDIVVTHTFDTEKENDVLAY